MFEVPGKVLDYVRELRRAATKAYGALKMCQDLIRSSHSHDSIYREPIDAALASLNAVNIQGNEAGLDT